MAKGNKIVVSANPRVESSHMEGIIAAGETPKPGTIMQVDPTVALIGGRHTYKIYNRDADGDRPLGPIYILLEDFLQGKAATTAYAAGERCFLIAPIAGEEFNCIISDVAGTADIALGTILSVDDTTGELIASTGETEPFVLLETVSAPAADQLAWVRFSGY
jgi:hypothetical protein